MKNFSFIFDAGFGYPTYLAHLTIGVNSRTLWFSISTANWNKVMVRKKQDRFTPTGACLSVFTVCYTD
jgi:hypothetical protein